MRIAENEWLKQKASELGCECPTDQCQSTCFAALCDQVVSARDERDSARQSLDAMNRRNMELIRERDEAREDSRTLGRVAIKSEAEIVRLTAERDEARAVVLGTGPDGEPNEYVGDYLHVLQRAEAALADSPEPAFTPTHRMTKDAVTCNAERFTKGTLLAVEKGSPGPRYRDAAGRKISPSDAEVEALAPEAYRCGKVDTP